jgi:tRNA A37 threonylcarbamoyladenosine synthetase subunit TsaC/SUA5/YrdC
LAPIAGALILEVGFPLTATSANLSGQPECLDALQVDLQMGTMLALIVDGGEAASPLPSTIVDLTSQPPRILREGVIPTTAVEPYLE